MKAINTLILVLAGAVAVTSCGTSGKTVSNKSYNNMIEKEQGGTGYIDISLDERNMVERNNKFALDFFQSLAGKDSRVLSPLSVTYLMSMLANGANGQTRQEILHTLGWDGYTTEQVNEFCHKMIAGAGKVDKATTLQIANYVAISKQEKLKTPFASTVKDMYDGQVDQLDFTSPSALSTINNWTSKHTGGMIPKLLSSLDPSTVACAVNAIYFKGTWTDKFKTADTKDEAFQGYTRDIKRVPMMHRTDDYFYYSNDTLQAVVMPYGNRGYEMTVVLPAQGKTVSDALQALKDGGMYAMWNGMEKCEVDLKLPRFTTETSQDLNQTIKQLGAPTMFEGSADFSNMTPAQLYVSKMLQKAKIEVSEEGTKAAAATAAIMMMTSLQPDMKRRVSFHANRPFIYMITERATKAIFFIGQYAGE